MKTFAVFTPFVEGVAEKRVPYREAHLAHLRDMGERGLLALGGALLNTEDQSLVQGLLIARAENKSVIEEELKKDSYWVNGIWREITIYEWNVVVGSLDPAAR